MRIAYLTTDEVNSELAQCWANADDCEVIPWSTSDPHLEGCFDAAIYDLDFLSAAQRQQVLALLLNGPHDVPVAVHSYNLLKRQAQDLCARGVIVRRRLDPEILETLRGKTRRLCAEIRQLSKGSHSYSRPIGHGLKEYAIPKA